VRGNDEAAQLASTILEFRRRRSQVLQCEIFGEPAWELLLELFVADAEGVRLTGKAVAQRSGTSAPVMSRWLQHLAAMRMIVGDGAGDLNDELTLSGTGMAQMEQILSHAGSLKIQISPVSPNMDS
jgi:hypothetical protein